MTASDQQRIIKGHHTGTLFYFENRSGSVHHEIILPRGVDPRFKDAAYLWGAVEHAEQDDDHPLAKEYILALPDDKSIQLDDRIELCRRFVDYYYKRHGIAVQLDIHAPHAQEQNWHAHLMATNRQLSRSGLSQQNHTIHDLDFLMKKYGVNESDIWGEHWRELQNGYFDEIGLNLEIKAANTLQKSNQEPDQRPNPAADPESNQKLNQGPRQGLNQGPTPPHTSGPVRMHHHLRNAIARATTLKQTVAKLDWDPTLIINEMSRHQAIFNDRDIINYCHKNVVMPKKPGAINQIFCSAQLIALYNRTTKKATSYFTTQAIRDEELKLMRIINRIAKRHNFEVPVGIQQNILSGMDMAGLTLSPEQRQTFDYVLANDSNFKIVQGHAGVGKSFTLKPIKDALTQAGFTVIGLAPTNKVALDMQNNGFNTSMTCHALLFRCRNTRFHINSKTVLIIDEAAMLDTPMMVELAHITHYHNCKLVLVGHSHQLNAINRGGAFKTLSNRYIHQELRNVRRQKQGWQRDLSCALADQQTDVAAQLMQDNNCLIWSRTKEDSLSAVVRDWRRDTDAIQQQHQTTSVTIFNRFILAQRNTDVDALNAAIHETRYQRGDLDPKCYTINTARGQATFSINDRIQFTSSNRRLGIINGSLGILTAVKSTQWTVKQDDGQIICFDPRQYKGLKLGYAGTVYKAQGSTLDQAYVVHDKATNINNSYVALTRQGSQLKVYINRMETKNLNHFAWQMNRPGGKSLSLEYATAMDFKEDKNLKYKMIAIMKNFWFFIMDRFHNNADFYIIAPAKQGQPSVSHETDQSTQKINDTDNDDTDNIAMAAHEHRVSLNQNYSGLGSLPLK